MPSYSQILKRNPYHDEQGLFTNAPRAKKVSIGGKFSDKFSPSVEHTGSTKNLTNDAALDRYAQKVELTPAEHGALTTYTGSAYEAINSHLRTGESISSTGKNTITRMDQAFEKVSAPLPAKTFRSYRIDNDVADSYKPGMVIKDSGFMSTSFNEGIGHNFTGAPYGQTRVQMTVVSGKGAKALSVEHLTNSGGEYEYLFARGTRMVVLSAVRDGRNLKMVVHALN